MNPRRLYRCRHDRQLAGVAAGMAEYLDLDPTLVRALWIVSIFFGGVTILLYVILAFVMPLEPAPLVEPGTGRAPAAGSPADGTASGPEPAPDQEPTASAAGTASASDRWPGHRHDRRPEDNRGSRVGLFAGVLLVVFGTIALADVLMPGWAVRPALGPAFLIALGAALVVASARRTADQR